MSGLAAAPLSPREACRACPGIPSCPWRAAVRWGTSVYLGCSVSAGRALCCGWTRPDSGSLALSPGGGGRKHPSEPTSSESPPGSCHLHALPVRLRAASQASGSQGASGSSSVRGALTLPGPSHGAGRGGWKGFCGRRGLDGPSALPTTKPWALPRADLSPAVTAGLVGVWPLGPRVQKGLRLAYWLLSVMEFFIFEQGAPHFHWALSPVMWSVLPQALWAAPASPSQGS